MENAVKIGFIGFGNMAQAMTKGLLDAGVCDSQQIYACSGHFDKLQKNAEKFGIKALESAKEVAEYANFIILAVKPYMIETVVKPIYDVLEGKVVISVAAGYNFEKYQKILKPGTHHISTIPNTPISVGEGILVCESTHSLSDEEFTLFCQMFEKIALIEMGDTKHLSVAGTLGACTPAFTAMYIEALGDAAVKYGLTRAASYRLAAKMICGTGKLYLENEEHPGAMKDAVCSPGGTTIRGVSALEKKGFRGTVIEAIDAIEGK